MKKLLKIFIVGILFFGSALSLVCCSKKYNWNNISVDPPILPIEITGFKLINFKTINPQNNQQTIPKLLEQLSQLFQGSQWNFNKLIKNYKFNNQNKPVDNIDLYRNGHYELKFNDKTNINIIKINKIVTTSNHLADKIKSIDLGKIYDIKPKTILIAIIFNNIKLISELDKFGEFFIGIQTSDIWNKQIKNVDKIKIDKTGATLITGKDNWSDKDNETTDYYGSVHVYFSIEHSKIPKERENLSEIKLTTNLGKIQNITILQVMMVFISINFVNKLDKLSILLNDLYLKINFDKKTGIITAYNESQYYSGNVKVTFY